MKFNIKALVIAAASLSLIAGVRAAQALPPNAAEALDLTEQQQAEFESLQTETRSQIEAILTDDQQSAVESSLEAGEPLRQALRSADLTEQQRSEIRTIVQDSREASREILTPEQQAQLQASRGERRNKGRAEGRAEARGKGGMIEEFAEELNLTADQQAQFEALRTDTRTQVEGVLTPDQLDSVRSAVEDGDDFRSALRSLDLSDSQREDLRSIFQSARETGRNILTEEQQEDLRALVQERRQENQGGRGRR